MRLPAGTKLRGRESRNTLWTRASRTEAGHRTRLQSLSLQRPVARLAFQLAAQPEALPASARLVSPTKWCAKKTKSRSKSKPETSRDRSRDDKIGRESQKLSCAPAHLPDAIYSHNELQSSPCGESRRTEFSHGFWWVAGESQGSGPGFRSELGRSWVRISPWRGYL